jgi:hypothetical protein
MPRPVPRYRSVRGFAVLAVFLGVPGHCKMVCLLLPSGAVGVANDLLRPLQRFLRIYQGVKNGQHMAAVGDHAG